MYLSGREMDGGGTMMNIDNSHVKILIVDDTPENLEIAGSVLEKAGYDIYVADSGQTALELMGHVSFDLILLDVMMPDMDGYEVCKRIKDHENYQDTPIIFLTAKADGESVARGFDSGSVDYIRKPFNATELRARAKTHIELKLTREELERKNARLEAVCMELEITASTDPLTKLLNRREMIQRLEGERVRHERSHRGFSLILADIDYFKLINDQYGHNQGDSVLQGVAELFRASIRKQDCAGRWGGEEFLVLLPETDTAGAAVIAEKLRNAVQSMPFECNGVELRITMTFGVAAFEGREELDVLVDRADSAMYMGKERSRNCVVIFGQ